MPTALELTREGWKPYLEAARRRPAPPEPTPAERRERARLLARVREAAEALKARFEVRRVVLFGSLVHEAWFVPDSDVDLAVEGLADSGEIPDLDRVVPQAPRCCMWVTQIGAFQQFGGGRVTCDYP